MQIHSISKVLAFPFVLFALAILYYSSTIEKSYSVLIFIPVFFIVVLYVFHGPLDHWYLSKNPIIFDPKLRSWLENHFPFYSRLDEVQKAKFEYRLGLYLDGRQFKSVGSEQRDVPEDIKCMVAAHGIALNLGLDDYLIGNFDRIFLYKHPFPSPSMPFMHTVETNSEDGVIILSMEQLTNAVLYPDDYFNVAYYAYAEIAVGLRSKTSFPDCSATWYEIEKCCGFSKSTMIKQTGIENILPLMVHIALFIGMPDKYKIHFPEYYERFSHIFNQRP